jgi:pantetheine-phosphate adenylyltransferase
MSEQLRTGIIVGSFDPFTIGHDSIVRRALPLFDRLVIGVVGDNVHKPNMRPAEERMQAILDLYADESRIEVKTFHGLAMDFAKAENAQFIVKGVRNTSDFEYEQWQADFNRKLGGIETILLYTEPELASISSSALRELSHFGVDVSEYIPTTKGKKK